MKTCQVLLILVILTSACTAGSSDADQAEELEADSYSRLAIEKNMLELHRSSHAQKELSELYGGDLNVECTFEDFREIDTNQFVAHESCALSKHGRHLGRIEADLRMTSPGTIDENLQTEVRWAASNVRPVILPQEAEATAGNAE